MDSYEKKQLIYKFILVAVFVGCIAVLITFFATTNFYDKNYITKGEVSEDSKENLKTISEALESFRKLIDDHYIGEIDEQKVLDETIKGYVNGIGDEYSEYMTADEWDEYQINTMGNYVGIGIFMSENSDGNVVVVEPIEQSPAEAAGLKAGDIIVEVNDENVIGKDTTAVAAKVKGEEGTIVKLKVLRGSEYLTFDVERKSIKVFHVTSKMLENNIGYIKLSTFDENCSDEFRKAYEELASQGAQKLIIDLRDNTGGLVDESLNIADMFVEKGKKLLITVDSKENKEITEAQIDPLITLDDIVVLVNEYSASASEILVGCLKDNGKVTVVGTKTYGKGVIQNVFQLNDGSVLKLTTAEYFTPNETKINKQGIKPDVEVEDEEQEEGQDEIDEQLNKALEIIQQ